ncbi:MAG TPA: carboxymuconolactone decarboxylase family protein [Phenylobacterium sp.]|nr:carboxymuconolactone decarboxylase family protein [Phenylobacterium sp.]
MTTRINVQNVSPKAMEPMLALEAYLATTTLEPMLRDLIKMRASQINGCAYCLHMHSKDARAQGEREERLYLLDAWRESSFYTERERAALAWTEALTRIADTGAPDADFEGLKPHFSEAEIVDLTLLITTINAWNRIAIGFRSQHPRSWAPQKAAA